MSLFLVTKDPKLRSHIDNQLKCPCHTITATTQLKNLPILLKNDLHPFILIDEKFCSGGFTNYFFLDHLNAPKLVIADHSHLPFGTQRLSDHNYGVVTIPFTIEELVEAVVTLGGVEVIASHLLEKHLAKIVEEEEKDWHASLLVGQSPQIVKVRKIIKEVGSRFSNVHISGETGTGKEVVATLLRYESCCKGPYVVENCSTIPTNLADVHLFGSVKGAYTDSKNDRLGLVKSADGGILFLDEIEDLEPSIQGKLLRLLETKRFRPVGSDKIEFSNFKLITASNRPLEELHSSNTIRFDLINRLNTIVIPLPPLKERREDIPLLIDHHLKKIGEERTISQETMEKILDYSWPGNIRELFKELNQLAIFAPPRAKVLSYRDILTQSVLN